MIEPKSILTLPPLPSNVLAGRIPNWRLDHLIHRRCPVCEADDPRVVCRRPDRLLVAQCNACRMMYLPEIPRDEELEAFYRNYGEYKELMPGRLSWLRRILPIRVPDPLIELLEYSGGLRGQQVCEVGCSHGRFLSRAREKGAAVFGVELDEAALQSLRRLGIPAAKAFDTTRKFDVVCAFQLIEHLAKPAQFVEEASRVLEPEGRLLLALPNGGECGKVGCAWIGYRVDLEHLNYFSIASISHLLTRYGVYVEHFWEYHQPNIPRRDQSTGMRAGWKRKAADLLGKLQCEPYQNSGTFVLCVLARKVAAAT